MCLIIIKCALFIAFFGFNISANDIQEPCENHKPAANSNKGYIFKIDIDGCRSSDDCNIKKGENLRLKTLMFQADDNSSSLEMHVLLGYKENENQVQVQIPDLKSDMCKEYPENLGATKQIQPGKKLECKIKESHHYTLTNYILFIPRLMPTGNVNLTLILTGDKKVIACALIRTNFKD